MAKFNIALVASVVVAASAVTGCADIHPTKGLQQSKVAKNQKKLEKSASKTKPGLTTKSGVFVADKAVRYTPAKGTVQLNAQGAPLGKMLQKVAGNKYSVVFVGKAQAKTPVTIQIYKSSREGAIRQLAAAAGYAAVIQPVKKRVMIARKATYTFHIPTSYFSGANGANSSYAVGGNTAAGGGRRSGRGGGGGSGGSMSSGMGGGSGSGGSSSRSGGRGLTAMFRVNGNHQNVTASDFQDSLQKIAGKKSNVVFDQSTGLVSVTASGPGLSRVHSYLTSYAREANTRVSVHAAVLQVNLTGAFKAGINWQKIIHIAGAGSLQLVAPNLPPALGTGSPTVNSATTQASSQLSYTSDTVKGVIQALKQNSGVRVISQRSLVAGNGTPATFFSGTQIPYVGSVTNNVSGLSGTSTSGAGLSYVLDGLSLSFVPDVVGNHWVHLQLIPALSNVRKFDKFKVAGTNLEGPEQELNQTYLQLLAPTHRTVILAGSKQSKGQNQVNETPVLSKIPILGDAFKGVSDSKTNTQLVILLRTSILPPPRIDPLVSESL